MSIGKYAFRYEKLKKRKKKEKLIESQKESMDKFVVRNKQNITQNLDENITNEQEIHQKWILNEIYYNIKILNKYLFS